MIIHSNLKEYSADFENSFLFVNELLKTEHAFFVIDKQVYNLYKDILFTNIDMDKMFLLEAIEKNKVLETALMIFDEIIKKSAKRNIKLISFGGGIVQDITGFVANVLYRGISWYFIPTTLLAACDSCIGGKTSLNYKNYKNLLGTFYPPDKIFICVKFFETLSDNDYKSGLGEVVKFNVIHGENGLKNIEDNFNNLISNKNNILINFVKSSLEFKKRYIEEDEFDKGIRVHLNYAHTFGHAFETISNYKISHGIAVSMGMIVANRISLKREWIDESIVKRIEALVKQIINIKIHDLIIDINDIYNAIYKDKKQINDNITAVLIKDDLKLTIVHDITLSEIKEAVFYLFNLLTEES